jgi:hypothetical protein
MKNLKLASREQKEKTIVNVGGVEVGHGQVRPLKAFLENNVSTSSSS